MYAPCRINASHFHSLESFFLRDHTQPGGLCQVLSRSHLLKRSQALISTRSLHAAFLAPQRTYDGAFLSFSKKTTHVWRARTSWSSSTASRQSPNDCSLGNRTAPATPPTRTVASDYRCPTHVSAFAVRECFGSPSKASTCRPTTVDAVTVTVTALAKHIQFKLDPVRPSRQRVLSQTVHSLAEAQRLSKCSFRER